MRIIALTDLLFLCAAAGCADPVDAPAVRRFHGDGVEVLLARDGDRLHGETRAVLDDAFGGEPTRVEAYEDAVLDGGRLRSADLRHRVTTATTVIERRIVADVDAGTLTVTRPGGTITFAVDPGAAWVPVTTRLSSVLDAALPSALACALLGAAFREPHGLLVDGLAAGMTVPFDRLVGALPPLSYGVRCTFDEADEVTELAADAWGSLSPGEVVTESLVARFDVAATPAVAVEACDAPARSEVFEIATADGRVLAGQIDLPPGDGPFPVVTFHSGTGGGDRDGRFHGAPQWTCLSGRLVAAGIAVVRHDDPGHGASPGDIDALTFADRDADAAAIVAAAAAHPLVDRSRVFALGHSEGAAHAARAAAAGPTITGLILVAGMGGTGGDVLVEQVEALFARSGYSAALVGALAEQQAAWVAAVRDGTVPDESLGGLPRAFWEQFVDADGAAAAVAAARPTLVIQGGDDWQVPPANADRIEAALRAAAVEVQVLRAPDLGHLLTPNAAGFAGIGEEYGMPQGFAPAVTAAIAGWVAEH